MAAATSIIAATAIAGSLISTGVQIDQARDAKKDAKKEAARQKEEQDKLIAQQKDREKSAQLGEAFKAARGRGGSSGASPYNGAGPGFTGASQGAYKTLLGQ